MIHSLCLNVISLLEMDGNLLPSVPPFTNQKLMFTKESVIDAAFDLLQNNILYVCP